LAYKKAKFSDLIKVYNVPFFNKTLFFIKGKHAAVIITNQ